MLLFRPVQPVGSCYHAGPLSDAWGKIPGLQHLNLSRNAFIGELPPAWADGFTDLQSLDLSHNVVNGSLPTGTPCAWA